MRVSRLGRARLRADDWPLAGVIAGLVVLAVLVRAPDAMSESLWWDEVSSARTIVAPSALTALGRIRRESSPPVWFFLGRVAHRAGAALSHAGAPRALASVEAVRLLSVLFSGVLTALVVAYAARLLPLSAAALAGLLAALGYQLVLHGKELRAYALLALLAAALPLTIEAAVASPSRRRLVALAVLVALGSLTHYFFLLALFVALVWLAASRPERWLRVIAAIGVGLVPLLAWLPVLAYQASRVNRYFPAFSPGAVFNLYSNLFAGGAVWSTVGVLGRAVVVAVVLAGAAVLARRAEGRLCALLTVLPVAVAALVWLLGLRIFDVRNLIVAAPFAAIAIAAAAAAIPFRPLAVAATLALAGASGWAFAMDRTLGRTPHDEIAGALVDMGWTERDPVIHFGTFGEHAPLAWHLPGHPRLVLARSGSAPCRRVFVVVDTRAGHRWLREHDAAVRERAAFPSYTGFIDGRRKGRDLVAASLSRSPPSVSSAETAGALLYHVRDRPLPPCVERAESELPTSVPEADG